MVFCHRNIKGTIRNAVTDQEENKAVHCVCSYIILCLIFTEVNKKRKGSRGYTDRKQTCESILLVDSIILYIRDPKNFIRKQKKILLEMEKLTAK